MRPLVTAALTLVMVTAMAGPASALTCGTFLNPLTVSATTIDFGQYDASSSTTLKSNGTVTIKCQSNLDIAPSFTVALSAGNGGGFSPRAMTKGGSQLTYNLYTASDYAVVWGDTNSGGIATQSYSTLLLLGQVSFTAYGRVSTGQYVAAGDYNDSITVTVTF